MTDIKNINNNGKNKKRGKVWELSVFSSLILLLLRIPLANIIGNEGNGYLAISWELYILVSIFFGYGINSTINDMVKRRVQKNLYHNSTRVLVSGIIVGSVLSVLGGLIIYCTSRYIFMNFYGLKVGNISFKIFSFYLFISTISGCIRGYFEGLGTKMPTGYSKLLEAGMSGIGAILLGSYFSKYGEKVGNLLFHPQYKNGFGAAGAVLGLLCGGILSLILLIIIYRIYQVPFQELLKKDETRVFETNKILFKEIFSILLIYTIPVLFFKSYRIVNITLFLKSFTEDTISNGVKYVGAYYGKVILLIFIFTTCILGFSGNNIGRIKRNLSGDKRNLVRKYCIEDIKKLLIFSLIFSLLLGVGAKVVLGFLFHNIQEYEVTMLQIGAVNVLIIVLATYGYLILSSLNKNIQIFIIFTCAFFLQLIGFMILLKTSAATYALIIGEIIFWMIVLILEGIYLFKILNFSLSMNK